MCKPARSADVRMLVLKRWNQAQTGRLFDSVVGQRGQYISFQSYHFIDIYSSMDDPALLHSYKQLRDVKNVSTKDAEAPSHNGFFHDTHIVQSMMLLGENSDFWEEPAGVMNITFIQLDDSTSWDYDKIKREISNILHPNAERGGKRKQAKWALYYSLDFCDFVLFTKHLKLGALHDLLWELTQCKLVQDTFTTNCFKGAFLKDVFEEEEQGIAHSPSPIWDDELALSMNFSVRDASALSILTDTISKTLKADDSLQYNLEKRSLFQTNRLSGRYDFRITTGMLKGDLVLRLLYQIDSLFNEQGSETKNLLYSYEIVLLVEAQNWHLADKHTASRCSVYETSANGVNNLPSETFKSEVNGVLKKLYDSCLERKLVTENNSNQSCMEYILETIRTLHELNNSGFSEEFVLSVLPSLSAFIMIEEQAANFHTETREDSEQNNIESSLLQMQKNYFSALNTLALCTMHSERQFIHAPAFNASYFEIPPKMLAFYSAIADHIASLLTERIDKKYNYLIAPDFRSDIYVKPLNIHYKKDTTRHLAIINLPEKYFYQPEKAIMLLAHEVGHYEGNRAREERAKCIFEMVGLLLLRYTVLYPPKQKTPPQVARLFAREFGKFLFKKYQDSRKEHVREIQALLDDVACFLEDVQYGSDFFALDKDPEAMVQRWFRALYSRQNDAEIRQECRKLLATLDDRVHTDYLATLVDEASFAGACDVITRSIINQLSNLQNRSRYKDYMDIANTSESIIQAFSEAFADKQMLVVMGDQFNPVDYVNLLKDVQKDVGSAATEQLLRYNAVRHIERSIPKDGYFDLQDSFQETVVESIVSYLRFAGEPQAKKTNNWCKRKWEQEYLGETDWMARCKIICDMLAVYKGSQFFKQA